MNPPFLFYDLDREIKSDRIDIIFDDWALENERIVFMSPHDDDAILGAGYLLLYTLSVGAEPYILILCDGSGGYSKVEDRDRIVDIRRVESTNAYMKLGVKEENIIRLNYPDFSLISYIGWKLSSGILGTITKTLSILRKIKPTRLIVPNEYREHLDHEAASIIGSYDGPQVGDPVLVDVGTPSPIKSYLKYSVWGDFSPEDALVKGRPASVRGNIAILASPEIEKRIGDGLREFKSQGKIIENLIKKRRERIINNYYMEVYMKFDPRPEIQYSPYKDAVMKIDEKWRERHGR